MFSGPSQINYIQTLCLQCPTLQQLLGDEEDQVAKQQEPKKEPAKQASKGSLKKGAEAEAGRVSIDFIIILIRSQHL